ncbi:MAG: thioredoxin domain-containing protein [Dehalococcoidia bacterium]
MASLKPFYLLLGAIAIVGGGAIFLSARGGSDPESRVVAPLSAEGADPGALPGHVMGSEAALIEVQEYADFQCPACQRFAILTMPDVVQRYINTGRVRWRFMHFPLSGHANSPAAHEAAACASEQGKFWEMHDQIYYNQSRWAFARNPERLFREYAEKVGVDLKQQESCLASDRYASRFASTVQAAAAKGVNSTPTFVIGRTMFSSALPFDQFKVILDSALAARQP